MPRHTMVLGIRYRERNTAVSDVGFCEKAFPDDLHESGTDGKYFLRRSGERRWAAADLLRECRKESGV